MKVQNAPTWQPSGNRDFACEYILNFFTDLQWGLIIDGSWQGDFKSASTLFVDNFQNEFELTFRSGAYTETIPANAQGYINVKSMGQVQIIAPKYCYLPCKLLTEVKQPGYTSRGNAPVSLIDSYYPKVVNLFHFSTDVPVTLTGAVTTIDSVDNKPYVMPALVIALPLAGGFVVGAPGNNPSGLLDVYASLGVFEFGNRLLVSTVESQNVTSRVYFTGGTAASMTNLSYDMGICLFHNYNNQSPGLPATPQYLGDYILSVVIANSTSNFYDIIGINYAANGTSTIFIGSIVSSVLTKHFTYALQMKNVTQYMFSYRRKGTYGVLFIDGIAVGSGTVPTVPAGACTLTLGGCVNTATAYSHPLAIFSEVRFTSDCRPFTRNFDRQNEPWPNG